MTSKPVTIKLDKERTITYDNRAEFRMGSLERPFSVQDLRSKRKAWAALVAWIWSCLSERDAQDFLTPESLAHLLETETAIKVAFEKFLETYNGAQLDDSKNVVG